MPTQFKLRQILQDGAGANNVLAWDNGDSAWQPFSLSGTANQITITPGTNTLVFSLASGIDATLIGDGSVTSTEFQYINSLTSNAQTQLNSKVDTSGTPANTYVSYFTDADTITGESAFSYNATSNALSLGVSGASGIAGSLNVYGGTTTASVVISGSSGTVTATSALYAPYHQVKDTGSANYITISAPSLSAGYNLVLPTTDGTANQVLKTDGSGNTDWVTITADGNGIYTGSGSIPNGTIATAAGSFGIDYNAGADALILDNTLGSMTFKSENGSAIISADSTQVGMSFGSNTIVMDSGGTTINNKLTLGDAILFGGELSPTQITADQNDYAPSGITTATNLRISSDAARNITGIVAGGGRRILTIHNIGSFAITLKDENASSTAANRLALSADIVLNPDQSVMLYYDATTTRWRSIGVDTTGGGSVSDADYGDITVSGGVWNIDAGVVGNTEIASGSGGIYKGNGTIPASTVATTTAASSFTINYSGGNAGFSISNGTNTTFMGGQSGTYTFYADNSNSAMTGGATSVAKLDSAGVFTITAAVSNTGTTPDRLIIAANSTGTATTNFGSRIKFTAETSTTDDQDQTYLESYWTSATNTDKHSLFRIRGQNTNAITTFASFGPTFSGDVNALRIGTGTTTYENSAITAAADFTLSAGSSNIVVSSVMKATQQYYSQRYALTDGATIAINWNNGNVQSVTLGGNRTVTFSNPKDGARYLFVVKQDATGSRTITWPTIKWRGGTAPTLTTTASKYDLITLIFDGTNYYGDASLNY